MLKRLVILVVEDDDAVREFAVGVLRSEGFTVMEAEDADSALTTLHNFGGSISMLFTDVQMPGGLNGILLARHTSRHWPWIALVVTSSGDFSSSVALPASARFLAKPYSPDQLVGCIRDQLPR